MRCHGMAKAKARAPLLMLLHGLHARGMAVQIEDMPVLYRPPSTQPTYMPRLIRGTGARRRSYALRSVVVKQTLCCS